MITFISIVLSFVYYVVLMFGCAFLFAFVSMHLLNPNASSKEIFDYWKSLGERK